MRMPRRAERKLVLAVLFVVVTLIAGLSTATARAAPAAAAGVHPNKIGGLDCNGLSPVQHPVKRVLQCADPRGTDEGRFEDNGHYIGHDEPSVRFLSNQPGSGSNYSMTERLPVEPRALPTVRHPGRDVTHTFELTVAPWTSTTVCDPQSTPMLPCTPESDANAPNGTYPGAGAAFVELQFYPPGFAPFADSISCDNTHWCSALTIDSLECKADGTCNPNCIEPVNFGFIQTNGVPAGPPSPQLSDLSTVTPNAHTLLMKPGDVIKLSLFNAKIPGGHALEARERDLTTGQSGFMIASAANGFMNTNPVTCDGTPFNFEPEYSSAAANNILPWGAGPYMLDNQFEIGHFEPCTKVTGRQTVALSDTVTDTYWTNCHGPYDSGREDPTLEPDDSPCYPFGDTHGGLAPPNLVTGCPVFFNAIGDLEYDGTSYYADWPTSSYPGRFPGAFAQAQPTTQGRSYPQIQFETDLADT